MKNIVEFREVYGNDYPSIRSLVSTTADTEKQRIIDYLRKGKRIAESPSRVTDFITGQPLNQPLSMQSDGFYSWRSDIVYYYENYNIRLNQDFIDHVLKQ